MAQPQRCGGLEQLMPNFLEAISTGKTANLAKVVKERLLVSSRPGEPPPLTLLLGAIAKTLEDFAKAPAEPGASPGQLCARPAPALAISHPFCELRRAMELLVHEGKAHEALALIDPLVHGVADYIIGRQPSSVGAHYEVATVFSNLCAQSGVCQLSDGLELLEGLAAYLQAPEGAQLFARLSTVVGHPALEPYLVDDGAEYGGENGVIALVKVVSATLQGMQSPAELEALPITSLPDELQVPAQELIDELERLLDPAREPNVLGPLKRSLNCLTVADANHELLRMLYRLGLEAKLAAFGMNRLAKTGEALFEVDARKSLAFLAQRMARALREDPRGPEAAAQVCRSLFSTQRAPGDEKSSAELALPVLADLSEAGLASELVCASDTLVFGCAGGPSPACP